MNGDLMASKTMRLVLLTMLAIILLIVFATVVLVVFKVEVPYVSEALLALTGNSGIGAARNAYTDSTLRQQQPNGGYSPPPPPA